MYFFLSKWCYFYSLNVCVFLFTKRILKECKWLEHLSHALKSVYFQWMKYDSKLNQAIWLAKSLFGHNWRTKIFLGMQFAQDVREWCQLTSSQKLEKFLEQFFAEVQKNFILGHLWSFRGKGEFVPKKGLCHFTLLIRSYKHAKNQKNP